MSGMFSAVTDYFSGLFGSTSAPTSEKSVETPLQQDSEAASAPSVPTAQAGGSKRKGKGSKKNKSNKRKSKKSKK